MTNDMGGLLFNSEKRPNRTGADGVTAGGDFDPLTDNYFNRAAGRTRVRSRSATRREPTGRCAASRCTTRT